MYALEYRVARLSFENGALREIEFGKDALGGAMLTVEQIAELAVLSKGNEPVESVKKR